MPKTATRTRSIYGVHPGVLMTQKWVGELKQKTGRSLDEWIKFIKKAGPPTEAAQRDWLKERHGLGPITPVGSLLSRSARVKRRATQMLTCERLRNTSTKCSAARKSICGRCTSHC